MPVKDNAYTVHFYVDQISSTGYSLNTGVTGLVAGSFESFKLLQDGNVTDVTNTATTELDSSAPGWYSIDLTAAENDGDFMAVIAKCNTATYVPKAVEWQNDNDPETIYYADIHLDRDTSGSGNDEYTVVWYKYGTVLTTEPTNPQIYVFDRSGNDLISSGSNMSEIGVTGVFYFDADGTAGKLKITAGESVVVRVTATIDGSTRIWQRVIGRDS